MELITPEAGLIIWSLYAIMSLTAFIDLLMNKMDFRQKLAWFLFITLIPVLSAVAYFIFRKQLKRS